MAVKKVIPSTTTLKRVPASELKKTTEIAKPVKKVKITDTASSSSAKRVSTSMTKATKKPIGVGTRGDDAANKRNWIIDTAETPKDKKNLPKDLAKVDKMTNWASRSPKMGKGK
jgi:hypothetical protein